MVFENALADSANPTKGRPQRPHSAQTEGLSVNWIYIRSTPEDASCIKPTSISPRDLSLNPFTFTRQLVHNHTPYIMAKNKRRKLNPQHTKQPTPKTPPSTNSNKPPTPTFKPHPHPQPTIPFHPTDAVLLIGEGDFSFAHSLLQHHSSCFGPLLATIPEERNVLLEKCPQAEGYIDTLLSAFEVHCSKSEDEDEEELAHEAEEEEQPHDEKEQKKRKKPRCNIAYTVDAGKMSRCAEIRKRKGGWDRIVFNFPHVGGKSTDVRRQVRYNQGMYDALPTLPPPRRHKLCTWRFLRRF